MKKYKDDVIFAHAGKRRVVPFVILGFILLALCAVLLYNLMMNRQVSLEKQSVSISTLPSSLEGFRILHISDLHGLSFGNEQENLLIAIRDIKYNAVCITGDMVSADGNYEPFLNLIRSIPEEIPVFFIAGDDDPDSIVSTVHDGDSAKADYIVAAEEIGAIYLDSPQKIVYGKGTIWFCPEAVYSLDLDAAEAAVSARLNDLKSAQGADSHAQLMAVEYQMERIERIRNAQREMTTADVHIALTHFPLSLESLRELHDDFANSASVYISGISLVLAGHYNAGQWRLPGLGAIYTPSSWNLSDSGFFPSDYGLKGLESVLGVNQYISPGLGSSSVYPSLMQTIRLFNPPTVTLLTLTSKIQN